MGKDDEGTAMSETPEENTRADKSSQLNAGEVILGERNYEAALDLVIARAERELLIFDQDFSRGAYGGSARYERIRDFLANKPHARLVIILQDASRFQAGCPRLFSLLQLYSHAMTVFQASEQVQSAKDTFVLADQAHYVRRFHIDQARFKYDMQDTETAGMLNMRFDELMQATSHTVSISTLGL